MGAKRRGRSPSVADAEGEAGTGKSAKIASGKSLRFTLKKTPGTATKETTGDGGEDVTAMGIDARDVSGAETTTGVGKLKLSVKMKLKNEGAPKVSFLEDEELNDDGPSESDSELEDALWAGGDGFGDNDFSNLELKVDHANRPLWVCDDGRIFLESFSPVYKAAYDFLISVAEPVCRPANMHEYVLTPHSLYAAVSVGLETSTILSVLDRLSKTHLSDEIHDFVHECTENYGKVKLVLQRNKFYLESNDPKVLQELLQDDVIRAARVAGSANASFRVSHALKEKGAQKLVDITEQDAEEGGVDVPAEGMDAQYQEDFLPEYDPDRQMHSFEIEARQVEHVKQRCLPGNLGYPTLEEYDFRNDTRNPDLHIELKPMTRIRPYQEKSLSKMFGNGRARSGIIVLPCGAGKSLTGIAAAARIRKSTLCLCTSSVSVDQWSAQFKLWTNLSDENIVRFTSQNKEEFPPPNEACVCVTTYNMVSAGGKRSEGSERILEAIRSREWGCMLLDEVHVVPAAMFRKVIGITKAHCKLGLTATLVREDDKVDHLNFLIGPKLYEANWLDLQRDGHIANVQCVEVWCPMTAEFFRKYCDPNYANKKQVLYCMNPNKFMACQFLMQFHEQQRKDKVIVFSDNIFALREYATALRRPLIYGDTSHAERTRVLHAFKYSNEINTIFLSKVGDNSIDIPEANVIIQISSHAGSRRQEAQRLGRILRPKAAQLSGKKTNADEHNAFFYSLVSTDTAEMYYSTKRQQFLIQQGYAFKVVTDLIGPQDKPQLMYSTQEKQLDLLAKVLSAGEAEAGEEVLPEDEDAIRRAHKPVGAARRTAGSMAALSGADGAYLEFDAQRGKTTKSKPSFQRASGAPRAVKPKNSILRERDKLLRGKK
jgi:DNA excision repair protein ERCC-3